MIVKGLKQSAGKHPAGKNPILGDVEKQFGSGSGSKKKFGWGRVAGTRQSLLITEKASKAKENLSVASVRKHICAKVGPVKVL